MDKKKQAYDLIRRAIEHKIRCWDFSCDAEKLLGVDIDTGSEAFEAACVMCNSPEDAAEIDDDTILGIIEQS